MQTYKSAGRTKESIKVRIPTTHKSPSGHDKYYFRKFRRGPGQNLCRIKMHKHGGKKRAGGGPYALRDNVALTSTLPTPRSDVHYIRTRPLHPYDATPSTIQGSQLDFSTTPSPFRTRHSSLFLWMLRDMMEFSQPATS